MIDLGSHSSSIINILRFDTILMLLTVSLRSFRPAAHLTPAVFTLQSLAASCVNDFFSSNLTCPYKKTQYEQLSNQASTSYIFIHYPIRTGVMECAEAMTWCASRRFWQQKLFLVCSTRWNKTVFVRSINNLPCLTEPQYDKTNKMMFPQWRLR